MRVTSSEDQSAGLETFRLNEEARFTSACHLAAVSLHIDIPAPQCLLIGCEMAVSPEALLRGHKKEKGAELISARRGYCLKWLWLSKSLDLTLQVVALLKKVQ